VITVITQARQALELGDTSGAIIALENFITRHAQHPQVHQARFLLGQALALQGDPKQAISQFQTLVEDETALAQCPEALFWLGRLLQAEDANRAAHLYQRYAEQSPHLQAEILLLAGELWAQNNDQDAANTLYKQALAAASNTQTRLRAQEDLAANAVTQGNLKAGAAYYRQILQKAKLPSYRTEVLYRLGQTLQAQGQQSAAWESYQQAIHQDTSSTYAYLALIELVNADVPVDPRLRAEIDINVGATTPAITLLHNLLATAPPNAGDLYALLARAHEVDKNYAEAAKAWRQTLLHSNDPRIRQQAWPGLGRSLWRQGLQEEARITYLQASEQLTDADAAATALWWAAVLAGQDEEQWQQAADDFMRLARTWPQHDHAAQAGFRAGLIYYRLGNEDKARALWQEHAASGEGAWQAAAHFWLGKLLARQGDDVAAQAHWQKTAQRWDANTFYGLRARQQLPAASIPQATPPPHSDTLAAAQQWVAALADVDVHKAFTATPQAFARIAEWHRLGEDARGHSELETLRQSWSNDGVKLLQIHLLAHQLGYYDISIRATSGLVALSQKPLNAAPLYIQKSIYPLAYQPLVLESAVRFELDPALFYGLLWQESHFWAPATSSAGAKGLAQIMPATGEAAAQQTHLENFSVSDLTKPSVSLYLGAYLLRQELNRSQENSFRALAAYNAGPNPPTLWWNLAEQDPDLFVELIPYRETQHYVRTITIQAQNYRRLYPELLHD